MKYIKTQIIKESVSFRDKSKIKKKEQKKIKNQ